MSNKGSEIIYCRVLAGIFIRGYMAHIVSIDILELFLYFQKPATHVCKLQLFPLLFQSIDKSRPILLGVFITGKDSPLGNTYYVIPIYIYNFRNVF